MNALALLLGLAIQIIVVRAATAAAPSPGPASSKVVAAAKAFLATLDDTQRAKVSVQAATARPFNPKASKAPP